MPAKLTAEPTKHEGRKPRASERHAVGCSEELCRGACQRQPTRRFRKITYYPLLHSRLKRGTNNSIAGGCSNGSSRSLRCYMRDQDRTNLATSGSGFQTFLIVTTAPVIWPLTKLADHVRIATQMLPRVRKSNGFRPL